MSFLTMDSDSRSADALYEAAAAIRPYLPELVGERAPVVDEELATILASQARDEDADEEHAIVAALQRHPATQEWTAAFLQYGAPPDIALATERSFSGMPGHGEPVKAAKFICPHGDFVWYRRAIGVTPPDCPTHGISLTPARTK